MAKKSEPSTKLKFFIGFRLTSHFEIKRETGELEQLHHKGRTYLGQTLTGPKTVAEIKALERKIRRELQILFPDRNMEALSIYLFPQLFIG